MIRQLGQDRFSLRSAGERPLGLYSVSRYWLSVQVGESSKAWGRREARMKFAQLKLAGILYRLVRRDKELS